MDHSTMPRMAPVRPHADTNTRWSLVAAAKGKDAGVALTELCSRYWCAVYAFLRRCGHPPRVAQELSTGFFRRLVRERLAKANPEFVLAHLRADLADAW